MEPHELDELAQRLVENPHDEAALAYAHQSGEADPQSYAALLERVGTLTQHPSDSAHWLSEAASVWLQTLGDSHRATTLLINAIERDPGHRGAAEKLGALYRENGDFQSLQRLLDRRVKALTPLVGLDPELRNELAGMHEELARLWNEPPLNQPRKALEHFRRAAELDPSSAYAIFNARELLKAQGQYADALPLYAAELALESNAERRVGLMRDEAETRKLMGDRAGVSQSLLAAVELDAEDPALKQEYATSIIERLQAGDAVAGDERARGVSYLIGLAEAYDGEHGLAYAEAALTIDAGHDRAVRMLAGYAQRLGKSAEIQSRLTDYLAANPNGSFASEARAATGVSAGPANTASPAAQPTAMLATGMLATGMLATGMPATAMLATGMPATGMPATGMPAAGMPAAGMPDPDATSTATTAAALQAAARGPESRQAISNPREEREPSRDPLAVFAAEQPRRTSMVPTDRLQGVLDAAQMLAGKGKKPEALAKYKEVLELDASNGEALSWVEDYLRSKRDYGQLRDVLLSSVRNLGQQESLESKKDRLREVAGLCEGNLRDVDGAVSAWRQLLALDRSDESARAALTRLLERSQRWDDLANLLEQEATAQIDIDLKVQLEKKLAKLQEDKRKDLVGAAEAWTRIARLLPEQDAPVSTAAKLYERAERADLAAVLLHEHAPLVDDPAARGNLLERLAQMREQLGEPELAGDSYAEAADSLRQARLWEEAERVYVACESWSKAANAATQRGQLTSEAKQQAMFAARAADHLTRAGDDDGALRELERATNLDPLSDEYADQLTSRFEKLERFEHLVEFLGRRGDRLVERNKRLHTRRQAAALANQKLKDRELVRELWLKVLEDGDDREALERLIDDAIEREDHLEATTLLRRLSQNTLDKAEKARIALREAELLAEGVRDIDTALARYEEILSDLDPTSRPALQAIADLQENRGEISAATEALERELKLVADPVERGQIAGRLARLYESQNDAKNAIRALDIVRKADAEDFDALTRLCDLCETSEQWDRVAELLAERIEVEGDEDEAAQMTMKLSSILAAKLDRGDEALAVLTEFADQGNNAVRAAYMQLGDSLGWKGVVAQKLVEWWFEARHTTERTAALRSAFERFSEVGRDQDAVRVAIELVRTKGADRALAQGLERLAGKTSDDEALTLAHDLLAREFTGVERAHELVRQAEVKVRAGVSKEDAVQHGEEGLASVPAGDAEPLLERLAALASKPADVVDLYERQITRCRAPEDRVRALARAAQVAAARGQAERAKAFYELALAGAPTSETLTHLETTAREGDAAQGGDRLRRSLAQALAAGGQGARDGGKTRAALLRRAANCAHRDLGDADQAFRWLGESLVASVDTTTLDELDRLGLAVGDPRRTENALTHALGEVFDGPLVRQLLARRAKLRREQLVDKTGAAQDLKRLHDLAPQEHGVLTELAALLVELSDYRALVHLYEDQILRGKDLVQRAELARNVARIWEEQLADARESADAWRRVLRMRAGDAEATAGLERAKAQQLRKLEGSEAQAAYAPPPSSIRPPGMSTPPAVIGTPSEQPAPSGAKSMALGAIAATAVEKAPIAAAVVASADAKAAVSSTKIAAADAPSKLPTAAGSVGDLAALTQAFADRTSASMPAAKAADSQPAGGAVHDTTPPPGSTTPPPPANTAVAIPSSRPSAPARKGDSVPAGPRIAKISDRKSGPKAGFSELMDDEIAMSLERLGETLPPAAPSGAPSALATRASASGASLTPAPAPVQTAPIVSNQSAPPDSDGALVADADVEAMDDDSEDDLGDLIEDLSDA